MKYIFGLIALLVATKLALNTPDVMNLFNNNKELIVAVALTVASRPFLKRIFD